jgi:hypothetical protein|eukprot:COSAG01_NODE_3480_length_6024_cov_4.480675_3_plen_47_part_00
MDMRRCVLADEVGGCCRPRRRKRSRNGRMPWPSLVPMFVSGNDQLL